MVPDDAIKPLVPAEGETGPVIFPLIVNVPPAKGAQVTLPSRYISFCKVPSGVAPLVPSVLVAELVLGATYIELLIDTFASNNETLFP